MAAFRLKIALALPLLMSAGCPAPSEPGGLVFAPQSPSPSARAASPSPQAGYARFEGEAFAFYHPAAWTPLPPQPLVAPSREVVNLQGTGQTGRVSFYVVEVGPAHEPFDEFRSRTLREAQAGLIASEDGRVDGVPVLVVTSYATHGGYEYKQRSYHGYHGGVIYRADFYHPKDAPDAPAQLQELEALMASWRWRASTD